MAYSLSHINSVALDFSWNETFETVNRPSFHTFDQSITFVQRHFGLSSVGFHFSKMRQAVSGKEINLNSDDSQQRDATAFTHCSMYSV